ncbi:MAG: hypothetical protein Q4E06_10275 [Lautropia sp.]|nr:hypothetical protein [Lautropia sp.]
MQRVRLFSARWSHRAFGLALALSGLSAEAAIQQVLIDVHTDGTPNFDQRDGPGLDRSENNRIVRTHDDVIYRVTLSANSAERQIAIRLTLPPAAAGQAPLADWAYRPQGCQNAGSQISADGQVIDCLLGDFTRSGTRSILFAARLRGSAANGSTLGSPTVQVSSATTAAMGAARPAPDVRVSAAPFYDVHLQLSSHGTPAAHGFLEASGPNGEDGFFHRPLVGLIARNPHGHGRKGVEQLDPATPVEVTLNLSGYPASVRVNDWSGNPQPPHKPATGSFADGCGSPNDGGPGPLGGGHFGMFGKVRDGGPHASTDPHNVANGGDCQVTASSRQQVVLSLSGIDTSLQHRPSQFWRDRNPIPADVWWVANKGLVLWTAESDYPSGKPRPHRMTLTRLQGRSISGQPLQDTNARNNQLGYNIRHTVQANVAQQFIADRSLPPPHASVPDPAVPGKDGVNHLAPGQVVTGTLRFWNNGTRPHQDTVLCQIIDRTAFDLSPGIGARQRGAVPAGVIRYGTPAPGQGRYFPSTDSAVGAYDHLGRPEAGDSAYAQASCDTPGIQWHDTPEAAEAAGGLVYVRLELPSVEPGKAALLDVRGLKLRSHWAADVTVQSPGPQQRRAGEAITPGTILRTRGEVRSRSQPSLASGRGYWDHLEVVDTRTSSRVELAITQPANAARVPVPAGTTLTLQLTPRFATLYPPIAHTLSLTSVLPAGLRYIHGSARSEGQPRPPVVTPNSPAPGLTTLHWSFPERMPHVGSPADAAAALPAITFQARASQTIGDGTVLRPLAHISGGANDFEADCTLDAARHDFGSCAKAASAQATIQTPPGFFLEKSAGRDQIEPGEAFDYTISFVSIGGDIQGIDLPDIIDILPFAGDGQSRPERSFSGRQPASRLASGAYRLTSIEPSPLDPQARLYYTRHAPREIHNDPRHASNALNGGSTRWCLAAELGTAGCPATIGDSTAIRVQPSIPSLPANTPYDVGLRLLADPLRARDGDIFANRAGTRPVNPASQLLYVESQARLQVEVRLAPARLSGQLFADTDRNGRQDPGELPLAGQCIELSGTTDTGLPVTLSTRSDERGHYRFGRDSQQPVFPASGCSGTALTDFGGLPPGTYAVAKPAAATPHSQGDGQARAGSLGGQVSGNRISHIVLGRDADGTGYDFTEWPVQPTLTLLGTVRNDHGGQARPAELRLGFSGNGLTQEGAIDDDAITRRPVPAGTYTLAHVALPGYRSGTWQCVINDQARSRGTQLTLTHGDNARCTLDFDDEPARLTLQASVTNSHGRTARPADFVLHARDADDTTAQPLLSGPSGSAAVTAVPLSGGRYVLSHTPLPGYVPGAWQCSAGSVQDDVLTLPQGSDASCTLNNTDQPVSLTLVLDIDNRHGGTARPGDVTLAAQGPDAIQGISGTRPVTVAPVRPGVYELHAPQLPGYRVSKWVCSAGRLEGNRLFLSEQQNVTCRVELKDIPPTFETRKTVAGQPVPVAGTEGDFLVDYDISIRHTGGADGIYSLVDRPAFDPDVQVISAQVSRNGRAIETTAAPGGGWQLAQQHRLAIDGEDRYRLALRLRIPFASSTTNDRCQSGSGPADGHGLLNRLHLQAQGLETPLTAHACIDTPVPALQARLSIDKRSTSRQAEVGDLVSYRLRIRNHGEGPAVRPVIIDQLPRGFRLDPGSVRVQNAQLLHSQLASDRALHLTLDRISHESRQDVIVTYRLRPGVGAQEGDGINRAHVQCPTPDGTLQRCSNEARWQVKVHGGIFSEEACVAGQIFVDCNGNSVKDAEELGIPGVRLYFQNGTWLQSDAHGKYSHCGLRPRTHVLKVDSRTLPRRSRLVTSSAQNSGDAGSLFVDARKGMLHRADFIEGSCTPDILAQVRSRQQGAASAAPATPSGQRPVYLDSQRSRPAQAARDSGQRQAASR